MRRIIKGMALAVMLALALLAAGCVDINITCGIEEGDTAMMHYSCVMDPSPLRSQDRDPARQVVEAIAAHLQDQGFTVSTDLGRDDEWILLADRKQDCSNRTDAMTVLQDWMTDSDFTPFRATDTQWRTTDYEDAYYLRATLDLTGLLDGTELGDIPPDIAGLMETGMGRAGGTLSLLLPGDEVLAADGETVMGSGIIRCDKTLSFTEPTSAMLLTGWQTGGEPWAQRLDTLRARVADYDRWVLPAAALFAALAVLAVILGILAARRRRPPDLPEDPRYAGRDPRLRRFDPWQEPGPPRADGGRPPDDPGSGPR